MNRTCAVVPAYNEGKYIEATIHSLMELEGVDSIVVVDDCSQDNTWDILCSLPNIYLLRHTKTMGKAQCLLDGVKVINADIYLFADSDLGCTASRLQPLVDQIKYDKCDFCIARIPEAAGKGGIGFLRAFSKFVVKLITGKDFPCPLSGQRAVKKDVLMDSRIGFYNGFGVEVGMLIDTIKCGYRVGIVDIGLTHRVTGRNISGFLHRIRQFIDIFNVFRIKLLER